MKLKTDTGTISNLQIVRTQQNILYSPHMKEAAGASAVIFAVAGMGAAAMRYSKIPQWPTDIEAQCPVEANDP
ncbi:hypothetical protein [Janthinobacterium sp. B9-8]|uniref:hypothetical protein n=1 Tax=Janthinobacterium sp. B9-8 TaxID=1236179 RepID=UPI000A5B6CCC|nr:hypothetical protein [Janthinobacterium sp. B9-8]